MPSAGTYLQEADEEQEQNYKSTRKQTQKHTTLGYRKFSLHLCFERLLFFLHSLQLFNHQVISN